MARNRRIRKTVRKAYRALRRTRVPRRVAKAGASNVGKAMYRTLRGKRRRRY